MLKKYINILQNFWVDIPYPFKGFFIVSFFISLAFIIVGIINNSIFTYDQARDALQAYNIWHDHHLKILGPATDIPGVFHGVLWFYLLAVFYALGKTPEFVIIIFGILTLITIVFVGILAQKLFQNKIITILSMAFYMASPLFQTTSRWLSNPVLSFIVTPLLLLFLWKFLETRTKWTSLWIGICFGLIIQSEFAFILLLFVFPVYWLIFKFKFNLTDTLAFISGLIISTINFFIAEIKFKDQGINGILHFFSINHKQYNFSENIFYIWTRLNDFFAISIFPFTKIIIGLIICLLLFFLISQTLTKNKKPVLFLFGWIATLLIFLLFHTGISTSYFLFFPFLAPIIIFVSFCINFLYRRKKFFYIVIIFIFVFEIYSSNQFLITNTSPLPAQQGATLQLAKKVVAYTYNKAKGKPFTINTITNPLYINSTWAYLYNTYGLLSWNYVPYFGGRSQKDLLGYLPEKQFATPIRFLIIEPTIGIPDKYIALITYEEDKISDIIEIKHIGRYIVEERKLNLGKPVPHMP